LVDCGVDDLGGVSPVTDDHINPDYAWPALGELDAIADDAGLGLAERLPVYDRYLPGEVRRDDVGPASGPVSTAGETNGWLSARIRSAITADNDAGERYRTVALRE